jgi:PPOX class probable F420-dependent enzyme
VTEIPDSYKDLLGAQFATLGTIAPDGRPQLTEVWFLAEDGQVKVSLNTTRKKVRNLRRNPAVSLLILDQANPGRYLEIRGDAQVEPDKGYAFAKKVDAKYGSDLQAMDGPGGERVVVTIEPVRVNPTKIF